ncbi:MAG: serine protease [Actinobacteria bacterium HGW-Actinobacteria-4]|nr:MAG: serine protease [Actinobacteria bacterium HGW-Actinobacteria-4]
MNRRFRTLVFAVAGAAVFAGCAVLPEGPGELPEFRIQPTLSPGDGPGALSPDGFNAAQRMTVRVRNVGCDFLATGTGFAIDAFTLVTNRHVIENSRSLEVSTYDGRLTEATAISTTTIADIAIVTVEDSLGGNFPIRAQEDPQEGDVITVVGYPSGGRLTTVSGVVLGPTTDPLGGAIGTVYATSAQVEPGSSGSPVLNESGEVVGVIYAKNESNQSFIVPVSTLRTLLAEPSLLVPESNTCPS